MVKVEKASESTAVAQVSAAREVFKLNAGDRLRNIVIDNVMAAKSEDGEFMVINFTTDENEELALIAAQTTVWGRNCISTFAYESDNIHNELCMLFDLFGIKYEIIDGDKAVDYIMELIDRNT